MAGTRHRVFGGLSRDTLLIAAAGLLADVSTEMLSPILPLFLTQVLHANGSIVGLVDGLAQATRNIIDGFAGVASDRLHRRKPIALAGFALSALAKPLMGISSIWESVLGARLLDRLGAGIRSAPRDALIAASVSPGRRGRGFGAESFGDNAGAFLGPLLAVGLLYAWKAEMRTIFYLAAIPGVLAAITLLFVREKTGPPTQSPRVLIALRGLPRGYWTYLLAIGMFGLGNSSDSFLILRVQELGASSPVSILIYAAFNLAAALISFPAGWAADRWGRRLVLLGAFLVFALAYLAFGLASDLRIAAAVFVFYGFYQGMFRAAGKALASDFVPEGLRASGIGWYGTTVGLTQLLASLIAGLLWDHVGHASIFFFGAASALAGTVALFVLVPGPRGRED